MKIRFKLFNRVFALYWFKVRKAYGIKSGSSDHYLLMDFDSKDPKIMDMVWWNLRQRFPNADLYMYETKHGFHAIVFKRFSFRRAIEELVRTPYIDLNHVAIGIQRGYWFLENPQCIPYKLYAKHPDLEFMFIERVEDEGLHG